MNDGLGGPIDPYKLTGIRIFGFRGCSTDVDLREAFDDFVKMAGQPGVYDAIDWSDLVGFSYTYPSYLVDDRISGSPCRPTLA